MTYNLTKKEKWFARSLVEQARAGDQSNPNEEFYCRPRRQDDGSSALEVHFPSNMQRRFLYQHGGRGIIAVLVQERLLIVVDQDSYKITRALFDLVDSNFEEVVPKREAQPGVTITELNALREALVKHFSDDELNEICAKLGVDPENISGTTKPAKVRGLVQHMVQHGRLLNLVAHVGAARYTLPWVDILP